MHRLQVRRCLWCCTLKRGGQVWGIIHMAISVCVLVISTICLLTTEPHQERLVFTPGIIASIIYLVFDLFLLIGLSREHLNMVLAWLMWNGSVAVCLLWYICLLVIIITFTQPLLVFGTILPLVYLSIETYFVIVVLSYYAGLKYPPGTALYNPPSRRIPQVAGAK